MHADLDICIEAHDQERTHQKGGGHRANLQSRRGFGKKGWKGSHVNVNTCMFTVAQGMVASALSVSSTK